MKFLLISPKNRTVWNFRAGLIKDIQAKGYEVTVTGPDQTDIEKIKALGVNFVEIPVNKNGTNLIGDLRYCKKLTKLVKELKPDAMLGYTIKPDVYGTIAGWLGGVKNINALITGGGYTFISKSLKARVLGSIVRLLYKFSLRRARTVIFQNKDDMEEFVKRGLAKKNKSHIVNGSGVDMQHFASTEQPKELTFFMLSRLLKSKGVIEYLEAAKKVKALHPEVRFTILGKYEDKMQDAVDKSYVEKLISDGVIERYEETTDVRPYYKECSVYVLPSYREGTPRTVLEAMSMGKPIITTDTNGCRETVVDGENGFLVPIKDADAVAEKMLYFIDHPEMISQMGKASRKYCEEKFEINKVNKNMLKFMGIE